MDWGQLLSGVVGSGLVLAVWSFFADRKLERFRDELVKGQKVHELQFNYEFECYRRLWVSMRSVIDSLILLLNTFGDVEMEIEKKKPLIKERVKSLYDKCESLRVEYHESYPFIAKGLAELFSSFLDKAFDLLSELNQHSVTGKIDGLSLDKVAHINTEVNAAFNLLNGTSEKIRERIRLEVRPSSSA